MSRQDLIKYLHEHKIFIIEPFTSTGIFKDESTHITYEVFEDCFTENQTYLRTAFERFDVSKTGAISSRDVVEAMHSIHKTASLKQASRIISMLDTDHDGKLNFQEFSRGLCLLDATTIRDFEDLAMTWASIADVDIGSDTVPVTHVSPSAAKFWAGGLAGAVSRSTVAPLERLKIIFMCGTPEQRARGVIGSLKHIYINDGIKGFFRGNGANMCRIFPYSAIQLSVFPKYKTLLEDKQGELGKIRLFGAGVMAGVTATTAT